jgi:ubiquinone/menaquinone biosynthesis C-methylase UbiE
VRSQKIISVELDVELRNAPYKICDRTNGQFRTPRHIIKMMVELLAPGPREIICDPACGTGGFLVAVAEYLRELTLPITRRR